MRLGSVLINPGDIAWCDSTGRTAVLGPDKKVAIIPRDDNTVELHHLDQIMLSGGEDWSMLDSISLVIVKALIGVAETFSQPTHDEPPRSAGKFPGWFSQLQTAEWVREEDMSSREKEYNPSYKVAGGYLRKYDYRESWEHAWEDADYEVRKRTVEMPGWDNDAFRAITGIDVEAELAAEEEGRLADAEEAAEQQTRSRYVTIDDVRYVCIPVPDED